MAGSPFKQGGGAAATTKAAPAKAAPAAAPAGRGKSAGKVDPADLPDVTNAGEDTPISNDPYAAADPTGVSGYKPLFFLGQLVLVHPTESGKMRTTSNTPENPESPYARVDIIPLTVPEPGTPSTSETVQITDGDEVLFAALNKDGEVETCEPYEVGERLEDILVFNKALVREFNRALDKGTAWLLGRIVKGNKKPGQSAPYILVAGSDEDKELYAKWRQEMAAAK